MVDVPSRRLLLLVLLVGITGPGFLDYLLSTAGSPQLGGAAWALGYGTMIIVVWYGWIRPLNLTGPDTSDGQPWTVDDDSAPGERPDPGEENYRTTAAEVSDNGE